VTTRERLPNRRSCESFEFRHAGLDFTLCAGSYPDGRIAEIFLSSHKPGSPIEAIARDACWHFRTLCIGCARRIFPGTCQFYLLE